MARERVTEAAANAVWHRFGTRGELAEALAEHVAGRLANAVERRGTGFLAISGGTTPATFLRMLSTKPIGWDKVTVALVDERFVAETSPRSNAALARSTLLQNRAAEAHFVGLYRPAESVETAAAETSRKLAELAWPLDVAILGMGADGHTASFFPDAAELPALLSPSADAYVLAVHADSAGEPRLTLSLARIVAAATIAVHIEGAEKRAVLEAALRPGGVRPISAVFRHAGKPVQIYWAP
jgi:6-phosphogluconolactonase